MPDVRQDVYERGWRDDVHAQGKAVDKAQDLVLEPDTRRGSQAADRDTSRAKQPMESAIHHTL